MRKTLFVFIVVIALLLVTQASTGTALAGAPGYHVVAPGQSLFWIANRYGVSSWAMAYANGMWNPNWIYIGQVLVIPYAGYDGYGRHYYNPGYGDRDDHHQGYNTGYRPQPYPNYQPVYFQPHNTYGCNYWVRWGDTMSSIAWKFGGDPWRIAHANGIYNLNWIYAGQRLFIPGCN
jgi:LysM repeat protein